MKAVLVIDIGNHDSDYYYIDYTVRKKETGDASLLGCKVKLRPLPNKLKLRKQEEWLGDVDRYEVGFNACIDAITGEFETINKAKKDLIESTNIEMSPDEMEILDDFLFRCWQMGWLGKYEEKPNDK